MRQQPNQKTIQEAIRLANSPAGQKLIELLKQSGGETVEQVKQQAVNGDYEQAKCTLSRVLQSEEIQKLMREMGKGNE